MTHRVRRSNWAVSWVVLLASVWLAAQSAPSPVFLESFRKNRTRIAEESFEVDLDASNPGCQIRVRDQSGSYHYQLFCSPERVGGGDNRILGWQLRLADLHHNMYANLLMATPDNSQDRVQIGWLDPGKFPKTALTALRVVKVDGFYCVFQVRESHLAAPPAPYVDRMVVQVKFTNTNPLAVAAVAGRQE